LVIKNGNNVVIKEETITKDINYIFYSSLNLDKNYHFYIGGSEYTFTYGQPTSGDDDQDPHDN
jgi:hypothetical protein